MTHTLYTPKVRLSTLISHKKPWQIIQICETAGFFRLVCRNLSMFFHFLFGAALWKYRPKFPQKYGNSGAKSIDERRKLCYNAGVILVY